MDYYAKYLKYKSKYLELQRQAGGLPFIRKSSFKKCTKEEKEENQNKCKLQEANVDLTNFLETNKLEWEFFYLQPIQIENIIKLKKKGFSDKYAYYGAKLEPEQIKRMKELKKIHNFSDEYAYNGAQLKPEQIKKMIELKKSPNNFSDYYAYQGVKDLSDEQIKEMINSKNTGKSDEDTYNQVYFKGLDTNISKLDKVNFERANLSNNDDTVLTPEEINKLDTKTVYLMIKLNRKYDIDNQYAYKAATKLSEQQLENMIELNKNHGFRVTFAYMAAERLTGNKNTGQIQKIIELKTIHSINEHLVIYIVKELNDDQIKKMIELKKAGFREDYAYKGLRDLKEKITIMEELKNSPNNFSDEYAYNGAQLEPKQIIKMIELKKAQFSDEYAYNGAQLKPEQTEKMIEFKTTYKIENEKAYNAAKDFTDEQIKNMKELFETHKFTEFLYEGAQLDDEKRKQMIDFKNKGVVDEYAYNIVTVLTPYQIEKMENEKKNNADKLYEQIYEELIDQ